MKRCIGLLFGVALVAFGSQSSALQRTATFASSIISGIPADGGTMRFAPFAGIAVSLQVPSSDAPPPSNVLLRGSLVAPDDAPRELRDALAALPPGTRSIAWVEAMPRDDVHFDPGDVAFVLAQHGIVQDDSLGYYFVACDRASCKPRTIGPMFQDGDTLELSNAHTPFHVHFTAQARHQYFAVVYVRRCPEGVCHA